MPIFFSNDQLERVVETYEKQQLTDTQANLHWQDAIHWLATRWVKSPAYQIMFALCRELSRLDYRLAHKGLNPGEYRYSYKYVLADEPTLHETEELFAVLAAYPQHLRTASRLAQAAMLYYKEHGQPLAVPHAVQPERADVQRVVE